MPNETLDLWPDPPPAPPRRSRLFSLAPIGTGTIHQEALSSYIVRLARAHSVSPAVLCNRELLPATEIQVRRVVNNFSMTYAKTVNGLNKYATEATKGLQLLTGRKDLESCTLLPWKEVLDNKAVGLLHPHPRWCPACFIGWRMQSKDPYWPLLWFLSPATQCPTHGKLLEEHCPHCGSHQPFIPKHNHLDYCSRCGESLAFLTDPINPRKEFPGKAISRFASESVAEMITRNPNAHEFATHARLTERLRELIRILGDGNTEEMHRKLGLRQKATTSWWRDGERPMVRSLLVVCYRINTTPVELLEKRLPETLEPRSDSFPSKLANRRPPSMKEADQLRQKLQEFLSLEGAAFPLVEVARQMGHPRTYLKYWFPNECRAICDHFRVFRRNRSIERKLRFISETEMIAREIFSVSPNASIKIVQERLKARKICLAWPEAQAAIKRVRQEYRVLPPRS